MTKKWLCVCEGGLNRSHALVYVLKCHFGQDAIAAGWKWNTPETLAHLCEWADYVVVMQAAFVEKLDPRFKSKFRVLDVGVDTYGHPYHADLQKFLANTVQDWYGRKFNI